MNLKGSKTEANLLTAFAGESQARNKYTYFASAAKKEGFEQIAQIFQNTADNEKEHAKLWFKYLSGGQVPSTKENLEAAASGEHFEWTQMYKEFAQTAQEEGFDEIAEVMRGVAKIEESHEKRYQTLLENLENNKVFKKEQEVCWHCLNCGHHENGLQAPESCPVCKHPKAYFEVCVKNY